MRFMYLVDGMGQLTATPVFGAMDRPAGAGDHALVSFHHGRDLLALVRMDQKHDFVMSHCLPFWIKSRRISWRIVRVPFRITATRLPGVARGFGAMRRPPNDGDANPTQGGPATQAKYDEIQAPGGAA